MRYTNGVPRDRILTLSRRLARNTSKRKKRDDERDVYIIFRTDKCTPSSNASEVIRSSRAYFNYSTVPSHSRAVLSNWHVTLRKDLTFTSRATKQSSLLTGMSCEKKQGKRGRRDYFYLSLAALNIDQQYSTSAFVGGTSRRSSSIAANHGTVRR